MAAAASSGTTTARGSSWSTGGAFSLQLDELVRIEGAEPFVGLDGEGQQQGGDRGLHHHVGEGQRLDTGSTAGVRTGMS